MVIPELLSPVGDFECLKAAVQNGADSVYFGASSFSARASAKNFDLAELKEAIAYAKLRNVKTHLTLNTLIKNDEFEDAVNLASKAYEFGIDAIIVQDLGLAKFLIKNFPNLPIHASTQMTVHNLDGVKLLEDLGFSRVVLARELSTSEIEYICKNSNIEIEVFVHGALCMSYSGRCLFSSMIGGRSGNRGRCAQPCRLPYELIDENNNLMDKGYLLSPRDLCGLELLPTLVKAGVKCFKIEGRMKTPEYVATVTRIYRKYLDKILNNDSYIIEDNDKSDLLQVFNRGGFSNGHLDDINKNLVFKEKSNNMGICIGTIKKYIPSKTYLEVELYNEVSIGDSIMMNSEENKYNVSELLQNGKNVKSASSGTVWIGRIKGKIDVGGKLYKVESKTLNEIANSSFEKENIKIPLHANIYIKSGTPIHVEALPIVDSNSIYNNIKISLESELIPQAALNSPITQERIIEQFSKTGNTNFYFKEIDVDIDNNLYISSIGKLNELRRNIITKITEIATAKISRVPVSYSFKEFSNYSSKDEKISLLLNKININQDYTKLEQVDRIYLPLNCFIDESNSQIINNLNTDLYIYLPSIIRENNKKFVLTKIDKVLNKFKINGFVISNISDISLLEKYKSKYDFIGNYTLNIFNNYTIEELNAIGIKDITLSPELSNIAIADCLKNSSEIIVYGNTPIMTMNYCLLGKSNKCYGECKKYCANGNYYLKDRMGFNFKIVPDNTTTVSTLYNSKITSISPYGHSLGHYRIDILDENIKEINNIINTVKKHERLEGKDYTNGNFNREV